MTVHLSKVKILMSPQVYLCHRCITSLSCSPFFPLNFNHCQAPMLCHGLCNCPSSTWKSYLTLSLTLLLGFLPHFLLVSWICHPTKPSVASLFKIIAAISSVHILLSSFFSQALNIWHCVHCLSMNCALFYMVSPTASAWHITVSQCEWILHFSELSYKHCP